MVAIILHTSVSATTKCTQPSLCLSSWNNGLLIDSIHPHSSTPWLKIMTVGMFQHLGTADVFCEKKLSNCLKSYIIFECVGTLLRQSLVQPSINRYWGGNQAVATLTFQDKSLFAFTAALPESGNYYKESWWLTKCKALSIRNMLWNCTVCQTPGGAEITKTNTTRKTEFFHAFEKVTFYKWAYSRALGKADIVWLKMTRACEASNINSPSGQGSGPPLLGGYRHCFQNLPGSSS